MRQLPALASRLGAASGGRTSVRRRVLSQLVAKISALHDAMAGITIRRRDSFKSLASLKVKCVSEACHDRRGLADVSAAQHPGCADLYGEIGWHSEAIHHGRAEPCEIHSVRNERHVLPTDVATTQRALLHEGNGDEEARFPKASAYAPFDHARHRYLIGEIQLTVGVIRSSIEIHFVAPRTCGRAIDEPGSSGLEVQREAPGCAPTRESDREWQKIRSVAAHRNSCLADDERGESAALRKRSCEEAVLCREGKVLQSAEPIERPLARMGPDVRQLTDEG